MLGCGHEYCCAFRQTMSNLQPFSATKECDFRRGSVVHGAGRLAPRTLQRIAANSAARHSAATANVSDADFAGSAYDRLDYDSLDEDTVEMVLSPEEMQSLNRAAEEALAEAKATRAMAFSLIAKLAPIQTPAKAEALAPASRAPDLSQAPALPPSTLPPLTLPRVSNPAAAPTPLKTPVLVPVLAPAAPAPSMENSAPPKVNVRASGRKGRWSAVRVAGAVSVVAATAVALASMTHHSTHAAAPLSTTSSQPTPAAARSPAPVSAAKAPAEAAETPDPVAASSLPQPVRVKNPFDRTEVFEFPPGTSMENARHSVAETLMQRAHDRGIQRVRPTRTDRHPVAQARHPQPVDLAQNPVHGPR